MYSTISSPVLFNTLDDLLYMCLQTLLDRTNYVECCISDLVNFQYHNKRRDISTKYKWEEASSKCLDFLLLPTIDNLRACNLDRGYLIPIISGFLNKTKKYKKIYSSSLSKNKTFYTKNMRKLYKIQSTVYATGELYQTICQLEYLFSELVKHKSLMIEAYKLYYMKVAHQGAKAIPLPIDIPELLQNFYLASSKAIDHFDVSKGAFKSYLDQWLKKALYGGNHFYGSAYKAVNKGQNHLYVDIDSVVGSHPSYEHEFIDNMLDDEQLILQKIVKIFDPKGITSFSK